MPNYISDFSGAEIDEAVRKVIQAGTLAASPKILLKTLVSTVWSSGVQVINDSQILANSAGDVKVSQTATSNQFLAFANALIQVTSQSAGSITVTCRGTVPGIDIPIAIEVR